ncbi:LEA type 2 family protein [Dyadobacter subterraneus]|uniref:LEA type 2 family protein n=1 Tax=Dyadobacter subterraneus TaxID=2773304 RepID=A0ABR9W630_9BACT|nr:LEA type 2 family protein [Dyadobacter subterraneus]MBE9460910.1 LEA type 2 family protein [Dyadobacter subterraneus]
MTDRSKTSSLLIIILVLLIGVGVAFFLYKSKNANPVSGLKPKVEMSISKITHVTDSTMEMSLKLLVDNPLPVGLDIKNFRYLVKMNGVKIIESDYADSLVLKSQDTTTVTLPTKIEVKKLVTVSKKSAAVGEDSADYHFETYLHLAKPFLGKDTLHFDQDKRLPLIRLPKVEMEDFDIEKFRLSNSDISIKLKLINPNAFSVEFRDPSYVFDLGKQKGLAKGSVKGVTKVKAKSSQMFEIPVEVGMGKALKTAGALIFKGKSLPFKMYFKCRLVSDNDIMKNSDMSMIMEGELKDLEKLKKNIK